MSNPYGDRADVPGLVRGGAVLGGIAVGFVGTFLWTGVWLLLGVQEPADGASTAPGGVILAMLLLPVPVAVLLLWWRRSRQAQAGLVMGIAIGMLAMAAAYTALLGP